MISQVSLQTDFLIVFLTMLDNFINIFPAQNQILQRDTLIPALPPPSSSFAGVVPSATRDNTLPDSQHSSGKCVTSDNQIFLAEPVILAEFDLSVYCLLLQAQIFSVCHKIHHAKISSLNLF